MQLSKMGAIRYKLLQSKIKLTPLFTVDFMSMTQTNSSFILYSDNCLQIQGEWTLVNYHAICDAINHNAQSTSSSQQLDFSALKNIDTAGAQLLCTLIAPDTLDTLLSQAKGLSSERLALLRTVIHALSTEQAVPPEPKYSALSDLVAQIGSSIEKFWQQAVALTAFIGFTLEILFKNILRPKQWRLNAIVAQIQETGLNAVPIIVLLTFLVGAVIAFLGATILTEFGATIYTVNLVGFSFLREFAVLLTAILMAGRTASAFTAQIGSMKANEELDALQALGLSPMLILVIPRVIAVLITMPLLTFIGMISGIFGGALVCYWSLGISPTMFIEIFQENVTIRNFYLGMGKAPIFAFLIAVIGCLEGLKVTGSAQSVGERTTASVVHSIFIVIVLDAVAALFFMEMGW